MDKFVYYAIHRVNMVFYFHMGEDKKMVQRGDARTIKTKVRLNEDEPSEFFKWEKDWMATVNKIDNAVDLTQWK